MLCFSKSLENIANIQQTWNAKTEKYCEPRLHTTPPAYVTSECDTLLMKLKCVTYVIYTFEMKPEFESKDKASLARNNTKMKKISKVMKIRSR